MAVVSMAKSTVHRSSDRSIPAAGVPTVRNNDNVVRAGWKTGFVRNSSLGGKVNDWSISANGPKWMTKILEKHDPESVLKQPAGKHGKEINRTRRGNGRPRVSPVKVYSTNKSETHDLQALLSTSRSISSVKPAGIPSIHPLKPKQVRPDQGGPADYRDVKLVEKAGKWVKVPYKRSDSCAGIFHAENTCREATPGVSFKGAMATRYYPASESCNTVRSSAAVTERTQTARSSQPHRLEEVNSLRDSVDHLIGEWKYAEDVGSSSARSVPVAATQRCSTGLRARPTDAMSEFNDNDLPIQHVPKDRPAPLSAKEKRRRRLHQIGAKAGLKLPTVQEHQTKYENQ